MKILEKIKQWFLDVKNRITDWKTTVPGWVLGLLLVGVGWGVISQEQSDAIMNLLNALLDNAQDSAGTGSLIVGLLIIVIKSFQKPKD
jgi:hypothetical protein